MITILRQFLRTCQISKPLLKNSRFYKVLLWFCWGLSLFILACAIFSHFAKADTPTPTPIESVVNPEDLNDIPEGFYYVPLISRGSWGYGPAYLRFDQTTTGLPAEIAEWEFTGVQGYYNYIEFTTLALGAFDYDVSLYDDFVIGYSWNSDNVLVSIDSVAYNGITYYDGETGFEIGSFRVQWGSAIGQTVLGLTYTGDMSELEPSLDLIQGHYLTLNTTYSVSAPDTVKMVGIASLVKEGEPEPTPYWYDPPTFPDVETDEPMPGDEPSYNGILGNLYNTLVWIGNTIKGLVIAIIGETKDLQLPTWGQFLQDTGLQGVVDLFTTLQQTVTTISNTPANASMQLQDVYIKYNKNKPAVKILTGFNVNIKNYTDSVSFTFRSTNYTLTSLLKYILSFPLTIASIYGIIRRFNNIINLIYGSSE